MRNVFKKLNLRKGIFIFTLFFITGIFVPAHLFAWAEDANGYPHSYDIGNNGGGSGGSSGDNSGSESSSNDSNGGGGNNSSFGIPSGDLFSEYKEVTAIKTEASSLDSEVEELKESFNDVPEAGTGKPDSSGINPALDSAESDGNSEAVLVDGRTSDNESKNTEAENEINSSETGDPVSVAIGEYILSDSDVKNVTRCYKSQNSIVGSFGFGWYSNLDEVILVGSKDYSVNPKTVYDEKYVKVLRNKISKFKNEIISSYDVSSIENGKSELSAILQEVYNIQKKVAAKKETSDKLLERAKKKNISNVMTAIIEKIDRLAGDCASMISDYKTRIAHFEQDVAFLRQLEERYKNALVISEKYGKEYEANLAIESKNRLSLKNGMSKLYNKVGIGKLIFVDENAIPHIFENAGGNKFVLASQSKQNLVSLVVNDGGYVLSLKDGTKKIFNSDGLLVQIVDRNENEVLINRSKDGKIFSVKTSFGENYNFFYSGDFVSEIVKERNPDFKIKYGYEKNSSGKIYLSSVTDDEGDVVKFAYSNEGKLGSVIKNDGSKIKIDYNEVLKNGTVVATSTTNEEGYTETFEYNKSLKKTVYTNHDGSKTEYMYDENNRTVYQRTPDGTEKYFSYDVAGNCISEITNGNTIDYSYDNNGNKIRADYSDGSTETWTYDKHSLVLEHIDRDGVSEIFERDSKGNVIKYFKGGNAVFTASYDSKGLMTKQTVCGENERTTFYSYDTFGNLTEKKTADRIEKYLYDNDDRIKEVFVNGKLFSTYEYTNKTFSKIDYSGRKTVYTTDGRKDLVQIEEIDTKTGEKRITKIDYDKRHLPVSIITGNGKTEKLVMEKRYTPAGLLEAAMISDGDENYVVVYSYKGDEIASQVKFKVKGKINFQTVDLLSLQKSADDVSVRSYEKKINDNNRVTFSFTDEIGRTQSTVYDAFGNNVEYENPLAEKIENKFSSSGKIISTQSSYGGFYDFNYDNKGNLIGLAERNKEKIAVAYNDDGSISSITNRYGEKSIYSYNEYGQVQSVSSPGKIEWYLYDSFGRNAGYVLGKTDNIEDAEKYVLYDYSDDGRRVTVNEGGLYKTVFDLNAFGEVVKRTDGNGNTITFEYDENGNRVAVTDGYGNTARFEYNCYGQITKSVNFDGYEKNYYYDSDFNLIKETDALGLVWQGLYDKAGRLIMEKGRTGIDKTYEYDELNRLVRVKSCGVLKEMYTYSAYGREVVYTDGNGNDYYFYKDEFGRTVGEKNRVGDVQSYVFDAEDSLALKKDFGGGEVRIAYKDGSKIVTQSFSDGSCSVMTFGMSGNVVSAMNDSDRIVYRYDKGGRMVSALDEIGGDAIYYEYDAAGNRKKMMSNSSELAYAYGKNNELISIVDNKQRTSVKFRYDKCGREISREFGNGVVQSTVYDKAGRVILVAEKNVKGKLICAEGYVYDSLGRQTAKVSHSGAVTLYEYDGAGHIGKVYYPVSRELDELQKEEAEENCLATSGVSVGENKYLSAELYNSLSALVSNMGGAYGSVTPMQVFSAEEYIYDGCDNIIAKSTIYGKIEYRYDAENRLVSSGSNGQRAVSYAYDANGNLTSRMSALKKSEYAYNAENRMVYSQVIDERKKTVSRVHYRYDAFGRRTVAQDSDIAASRAMYDGLSFDTVKVSPVYPNGMYVDYISSANVSGWESSENRYSYINDGQSESKGTRGYGDDADYSLALESADAERVFISIGGTPVAVTQISGSMDSMAGSWYYGTDIRGSVAAATDSYGELKEIYGYDVMGRCLCDGALPDYGYCGKSRSRATGLYDYGFRDYDAAVGRFTTMDPVRDGVNWFAYCGGDAVNFVDLWGLELTLTVDKEKQTMRVQLELPGYHYETEIQVTTAVVSGDSTKISNSESKNENGSHWTQFPNGTWNLTGTGQSSNQEVAEKYGIWITTDAHQILKTDDGKEVDDYGYFIHVTPYSNTAGCVGLNNGDVGKNNMNLLLMLYNYNEAMDPNSGKIVVEGDPTKHKNK